MSFTNAYSAISFWIATSLAIAGLVAFIIQVARWDCEYEDFLIFPLRLAIYAIPYLLIPVAGFVAGGIMIGSSKRVKHMFAKASLYVSIIGVFLWGAVLGLAIR